MKLVLLLKLFHEIQLLLLTHFDLVFRASKDRARINLLLLHLLILFQCISFRSLFVKYDCILVDGPANMQGVNLALLVANFERLILIQEVYKMQFFFECVIANGEVIEKPSLLGLACFKFKLFQIFYVLCQTFVKVLLAHERRNPPNDCTEHFAGLDLDFDLIFHMGGVILN